MKTALGFAAFCAIRFASLAECSLLQLNSQFPMPAAQAVHLTRLCQITFPHTRRNQAVMHFNKGKERMKPKGLAKVISPKSNLLLNLFFFFLKHLPKTKNHF